uniref:Uncharacterized protein n=1 Tax=Arundo donax TaxID=35708 RepID=A0A0A9FX79_ARUDO
MRRTAAAATARGHGSRGRS